MKTVFIEARFGGKTDLGKIGLKELPKDICLISAVQFAHLLDTVKGYLIKNGINAFILKGRQKYHGQIIGCDVSAGFTDKADAFLYIGDGRFHPAAVAFSEKKDVFCYNPMNGFFDKITEKEIKGFGKKKKAKLARFFGSERIGILVSTKSGQSNLKKGLEIKAEMEKKGKKCFLFLFDSLNMSEFDNFSFIEIFVNTACPRIEEDSSRIINYQDVEKFA